MDAKVATVRVTVDVTGAEVFVDGRNQLFEHGAFEDEARIERLENWAAIIDRYSINTVLWEKGSALDVALAESGAWQEVHRGRIAVLYVRRPSQNPLSPAP